jgi:hypothetical protein
MIDKTKITQKKPGPKVKVKRKGKKSLPFDQDAEILARLAVVAEMMLVGAKPFQIASTMDYSLASANRDLARIKQLWKENAREEIDQSRIVALAQYRLVLMRAWEEFGKKGNECRRHLFLNQVLATQREIDRVLGVGPQKLDLSGSVEVTEDIEEIRKRRWEQITPQLAEMLRQTPVKN